MSFPMYPAYMDAGVDWLGKIPEHWQQKWLGLLAVESRTAFVDGPFGSDLKSSDYQEAGVPLIQLNNIRDGQHVLRNMKFISEEKRNELSRHSAFPGDIVIAKMADPVARSAIVSEAFAEYVIVADCVKMTPDLASVDLSFLIWTINSDCVRISAELMSSGVTRIRINLGQIKKLKIPYPPICEQAQIARFLDHETARIDALIEEQQRLIELLKEKRQAVISQAVTKGLDPTVSMKDSGVKWLGEVPAHWVISQLKFNTLEMQTDPFGSQLHAEDYVDGGIPLVNPAHMIDGEIIPDTQVTVDEVTWQRLKRHALTAGDIIFARRGELGRCAIVTNEQAGWLCGTGSLKAKLNAQLDAEYAYLLITSKGAVAELSLESKGSTMENLNTETLGRIRLPLPPVSEQKAILEYVHEVSGQFATLVDAAESGISLITERRSALISAVVTGKIDVRSWQPPASAQTPELAQEAV